MEHIYVHDPFPLILLQMIAINVGYYGGNETWYTISKNKLCTAVSAIVICRQGVKSFRDRAN